MPQRLIIALLLIVALPLVAMVWLGLELAARERAGVEQRLAELLTSRLEGSAATIEAVVAQWQSRLMAATAGADGLDSAGARRLVATDGAIDQLLLLTAAGQLRLPDPGQGLLSLAEQAFLERTRPLRESGALHPPAPEGQEGRGLIAPGWLSWHWGDGMSLIFYRGLPGGEVVAAEVDRLALLADIIAALPDQRGAGSADRIRLLDARGRILYQWGGYEPPASELPRAELPLAPPLESWHLAYFSPTPITGAGTRLLFSATLLVLLVGLGLAAFYVVRQLNQALREAAQRVNFVNQVSHELKTPLTNIRLYAELLQGDLEEEPEAARKAGIIVAESQRLSRLIGNVLSFARGQRGTLRLNWRAVVPDECLREVLEQFAPGFEQAGIAIQAELAAPQPQPLDPDALAQIAANLLGNVEKYAAAGGRVVVTSSQAGAGLSLTVRDFGPGIPKGQRERIFRPFHRIRSDLTEGVSGTGLGLTIARDLARLHGGDLTLTAAAPGAQFTLTIPRRDP